MGRFLLILLLTVSLPILAAAEEQLTAKQLAQQVYDRYLGDDMKMQGTMQLISEKGHVRTREYILLRKDGNNRKQLIRFSSPADIDGTAFLTLEKNNGTETEQHLYLPALKRTRRIAASQKGRSFVNSDFTYEDMQRHPVKEWSYQLSGEETLAGSNCYILISTPKPGTDTQYGKLISWIEKKHLIPLKIDFYNKKGQQIKTYKVNKYEIIDNIATEIDVTMEDLDSGHKTRLQTKSIIYNSGLKDSHFTTRALER